jgi:hypothetical protein
MTPEDKIDVNVNGIIKEITKARKISARSFYYLPKKIRGRATNNLKHANLLVRAANYLRRIKKVNSSSA